MTHEDWADLLDFFIFIVQLAIIVVFLLIMAKVGYSVGVQFGQDLGSSISTNSVSNQDISGQ